ncbi:MAG: hypothetical protein IT371_01270 [Deltaproteobacteria bacterium]|nr:hypothetical protein [Deltaproteobacteria bacterium]
MNVIPHTEVLVDHRPGARCLLKPITLAAVMVLVGLGALEASASPRLDVREGVPRLSPPSGPVLVASRRRRKRPTVAPVVRKPKKGGAKAGGAKGDADASEGGSEGADGAAAGGGSEGGEGGGQASAPPPSAGALQRGARVEFDGRLVQGQMAKSGAIYLFARKRSQLRSMVKERTDYRKEILRTVYPSYESN